MKISSRSKQRVARLMKPPVCTTGRDTPAPRGLTVRALVYHKKHQRLRREYTIIQLHNGQLVSVQSLIKYGFGV